MNRVYLDYAATTPLDARVRAAMEPYFTLEYGNPSSIHQAGQQAEAAVEEARGKIAACLNAKTSEVIFTSGGTESNNLALRGAALAQREKGKNHLLISPVEHTAVSKTAEHLARYYGYELEYLPIDSYGIVSPDAVRQKLRSSTAFVSVIYANNEIGTINPIQDIGMVCQENGVLFHTDAMQASNYYSLDTQALHVDLLTFGGHKMYGPKGIGGLFVKSGTPLIPTQTGGAQEFGLRAGTHNVPYIIGLAAAFSIALAEREVFAHQLQSLRDTIIDKVCRNIPDARLTGHPATRMPNHASFAFRALDGNLLLMLLDQAGYACSSGSACKTGSPEPSEVLLALGFPLDWASGSLRVTLGKQSTRAEVEQFTQDLPDIVSTARNLYQV